MVERCARAIYDATDPLSGDSIAAVIIASDELFPGREHYLQGEPYQLAAMEVCRTAARAVIEALMEPTPEMVQAGERSFTGSTYLGLHQGQLNGLIAAYSAMLRTALSQPNEEGEGK